MAIDFTEIPAGNKTGEDPDKFEQFACDFFESLDFIIEQRPNRGPDGKKDLIVRGKTNLGTTADHNLRWLVSCKHYAKSNKSVNDVAEPDVSDRIKKHNCHGFIGFYSTIPSSTLSDKLHSINILYSIYDCSRIEKELLNLKDKDRLLYTYFPKSYEKNKNWIKKLEETDEPKKTFTENEIVQLTKTAIIELEIEKVKQEINPTDWKSGVTSLEKLFQYADHRNERLDFSIIRLLYNLANLTRHNMPSKMASTIFSLVITFSPKGIKSISGLEYESRMLSIFIGFSMTYDAIIHLSNLSIAMEGLGLWKFIYRDAKEVDNAFLMNEIHKNYTDLEYKLDRPERNDLEDAKRLIQIFKNDLDFPDLSYPELPDDLYELVNKSEES